MFQGQFHEDADAVIDAAIEAHNARSPSCGT
jgi:hypothetical protein